MKIVIKKFPSEESQKIFNLNKINLLEELAIKLKQDKIRVELIKKNVPEQFIIIYMKGKMVFIKEWKEGN